MKIIAILTGGYSSERHISINTAKQIYSELNRNLYNPFLVFVNREGIIVEYNKEELELNIKDFSFHLGKQHIRFDFVINALHGTPGEDGKIQGLLDIIGIPYSSSGVFCSALTFDKIASKKHLSNTNIPMAKMLIHRKGDEIDKFLVEREIGYPCFVKPNMAGSSYGVSKVFTEEELEPAIMKAYEEDNVVLIEQFIDGIEVSCGVLKTRQKVFILPLTEIDTDNEYFDTEAKYDENITREITPARVPEAYSKLTQEYASKIYDEFSCKGIVRIDFIIQKGIPYFLEVNTIPGMSAASIVPKQLKTVGMSIGDIFHEIIIDAF